MHVEPQTINDVLLIRPRRFPDMRGLFLETWHRDRYARAGMPLSFVQDNISVSHRGVLRGLHTQRAPHAQGKLITVLAGRVFDVAVDVRPTSPTFGQHVAVELTADGFEQLYIPPGFLHGFQALEDGTVFSYKCTAVYDPLSELTVRWNDPTIGVVWPLAVSILNPKDAQAPFLADIPLDHLAQNEAETAPLRVFS